MVSPQLLAQALEKGWPTQDQGVSGIPGEGLKTGRPGYGTDPDLNPACCPDQEEQPPQGREAGHISSIRTGVGNLLRQKGWASGQKG